MLFSGQIITTIRTKAHPERDTGRAEGRPILGTGEEEDEEEEEPCEHTQTPLPPSTLAWPAYKLFAQPGYDLTVSLHTFQPSRDPSTGWHRRRR